jgi:transposase
MSRVIVGVDPHKKSVTIEVVDEHETVLAQGRYGTDTADYRRMLKQVRDQWPEHRWAVEGAQGVGRPLAQRLLAQGEDVVDVPAKLAARVRVFDTGNARKTDATDAHAVAMVALRTAGLRELTFDEELLALRLLTDRREELAKLRVQTVNRLHRLLTELIPGGANKRDLSALQAKRLVATVKPRSLLGKTTRRMVVEEIADLVAVDAKLKAIKKELKAAVLARGSHLMDLFGVGPAVAARVLADVGDVARFPDRNHFASWTGTAPLDASSGEQIRHRLSRAGNRRMNHVIHIAAIVQIRHDTEGRAYYRRKLAESKTPMEALRCLKRRISDAIYRQLVADADLTDAAAAGVGAPEAEAGPGGQSGASSRSSAADLSTPVIGSSEQPLPGPATPTLPPPVRAANPQARSAPRPPRRRAGAVKVQRPTGRTTLTATSAGAHSKTPKPRS